MVSLSFIVGIIGNVISVLMFASPISTFWQIVKKKSTQDYEGLPYVTTLMNASLWSFYGILKPGGLLILTVNGAGSVLQTIFVTLFLIYAPPKTKVMVAKMAVVLNVILIGAVVVVVMFAFHGYTRLRIVGTLGAVLSVCMYAAPMAIMRLVVQTKNVKFMPFSLSFSLFLNAGVWTTYAVLLGDYFIGVPSAIGFLLGTAQLVIYAIYRNKTPQTEKESNEKTSDVNVDEVEMGQIGGIQKLNRERSLPLKVNVSRQQSLTKLVSSLSLPPFENSYWINDHYENEVA